MKKLEVFKQGLGLVVGVGVGAIAGTAVKSFSPTDVNTIKKICISVGGIAITSMVTSRVTEFVDEQVDTAAEQISLGVAQYKRSKLKVVEDD